MKPSKNSSSFWQSWLVKSVILGSWFLLAGVLYTRPPYWSPHNQQPLEITTITGEFDSTEQIGEFHGKKVQSAEVASTLAGATGTSSVLGVEDTELADEEISENTVQKHIEVDLTNQRLYAFENGEKVYDFLISSGKWGRTPTGKFTIWSKFKYTKMSGGSQALRTYYYLPNVPFVMFFSNDEIPASRGFGLHGTYWHENFGHPMSHGCVNMKTEEAEIIYYWSSPAVGESNSVRANKENPGTEIYIYGVAPQT